MYNTSRDWELDWLVRDEERNNGLDLMRMVGCLYRCCCQVLSSK